MSIVLYGLKNCDSCRKAMKALPQAELHDIRVDGVPTDVLEQALNQFGQAVVNTRSTTWRGLDDATRELPPLTLLKEHPTLMKRPLIAVDKTLFLSWNSEIETQVKALL